MNEKDEQRSTRMDGIWLLLISVCAMTLLLLAACGQNNSAFEQATGERQHGSTYYDITDQLPDEPRAAEEPEQKPKRMYSILQGPRNHDRIHVNLPGRLRELFNDSNKYQYAAAERLGLTPLTGVGNAYYTTRPVVLVESNKFYTIDSLSHSLPFLVPEAEKLLHDIGSNFIDSLASRGADGYRIMVTSLLRTPQTVKRLRRINRNAVDSSTHQFGTTFDISYTRFHCLDETRTINEEDLKNLLGEVLLDLRTRERCLVKFEAKGGCFHITATR